MRSRMAVGTRSAPLSPRVGQEELDVPLSPPRTIIEKEGVEVVMPLSPTSVFVLMDDEQIQHVKPGTHDDSCFYTSDASETASIAAFSIGSKSLLGASFLNDDPPTAFPSIPRMVIPRTLQGGVGSGVATLGLLRRPETDYFYSDDEDEEELNFVEEEEEEAELLGLRCLPEAMMCAPFAGLLEDNTWETFWGATNANMTGTTTDVFNS